MKLRELFKKKEKKVEKPAKPIEKSVKMEDDGNASHGYWKNNKKFVDMIKRKYKEVEYLEADGDRMFVGLKADTDNNTIRKIMKVVQKG